MSGLARWLRAHPRERTLIAAAVLLVACGLGLHLLAPGLGAAPLGVQQSATRPQPAAAPAIATSATTAPTPSSSPPQVVQPVPAELAQAEAVARAFLVAYGSYRYDEPEAALPERLRPYVSAELEARLAGASSGAAQRQQMAARQEVATASVERLSSLGLAPDGHLVLVAQVRQSLSSTQGQTTSSRYLELFMVRTPAGWRVAEVSG